MRLAHPGPALAVAVATGAAAVLLAGCSGTSTAASGTPAGAGFRVGDGTATVVPEADRRPAPSLRGLTLDGRTLDVGDYRGSVVVLNVWGSWCAPCKKEQPDLQRAAVELAASGVRFVGINVRDRSPGTPLAHVRRYGVTYPSLFDRDMRLVASFRDLPPNAIPSTIVLDAQGRVAARVLGATTYDDLVDLVDRVQ